MSDYWFRPKAYGYGATPSNWKGWAATLGFTLLLLVLSVPLMVRPAIENTGPVVWQVVAWLAMIVVLSLGFFRFCQARTDGAWRWRWGEKEGDGK